MDSRRLAAAAAAVTLVLCGAPERARASDQSAVMAVVHQFVDAYDHGDFTAAAKTCASASTAVDEFPPHVWMGPSGCADWGKAYQANAKANDITNGVVTLGKPWTLAIDGDRAYAVFPAKFTWLQNGKPAEEPSSVFTLVLGKMAAGWRIMAWSWSEHVVQ